LWSFEIFQHSTAKRSILLPRVDDFTSRSHLIIMFSDFTTSLQVLTNKKGRLNRAIISCDHGKLIEVCTAVIAKKATLINDQAH